MERSEHSSRHAFVVPKQEKPSTIATPVQPKWDCFGLFKSNSISPERIEKRKKEIDALNKRELKNTLQKAESDAKLLKVTKIPVPVEVKTNLNLLRRKEVRLTSTVDSVVEEENVPRKISKLGWLMYNRMKRKS
jgi:hypothetical protein